jgi:competence protein ComEC
LLAPPRAHTRCEAGQSWRWDGVDFRVLHPRAEDYLRVDPKPNTLSCVLSVTDAQGRRVLLTGDLEAEQEARLARDEPGALRSDVLVVPHHGSKTSSSSVFLAAVSPRLALVQSGYRNRYGHPAPEVANRYAESGIRWVTTVECGAWLWLSADSVASGSCARNEAARYWHHRSVPE